MGPKVKCSQDGHLGEGGRDGQDEQDEAADTAEKAMEQVRPSSRSPRAMLPVRACDPNHHDQLEHQGRAKDLVAEPAQQQPAGVGVAGRLGVPELDLADEPAREDGEEAERDGQEDAGKHAQRVVRGRQAEGAQGHGLDNGDDGEPLPPQPVEMGVARGRDLLQPVLVHFLARLAKDVGVAQGPAPGLGTDAGGVTADGFLPESVLALTAAGGRGAGDLFSHRGKAVGDKKRGFEMAMLNPAAKSRARRLWEPGWVGRDPDTSLKSRARRRSKCPFAICPRVPRYLKGVKNFLRGPWRAESWRLHVGKDSGWAGGHGNKAAEDWSVDEGIPLDAGGQRA
ncbi:hypothetical protein J3459_011994 [Metarhizium acridum]|nr:hypothetical protein J3459_011994 [Metarhizium acridum]